MGLGTQLFGQSALLLGAVALRIREQSLVACDLSHLLRDATVYGGVFFALFEAGVLPLQLLHVFLVETRLAHGAQSVGAKERKRSDKDAAEAVEEGSVQTLEHIRFQFIRCRSFFGSQAR